MMSYCRVKSKYDGKIAGLYDLEETIGRGHYAVVKVARHVFTGERVAVKVIDKTRLDDISKDRLFQEVRCMKLVQHPNVVRLYEVIDTQTKLYLILELGDGGDLYDYIMKHDDGLTESEACFYFGQIVDAISYCHQLHVVHRDLKPENVVFFNKANIVKLTDFGFSNCFIPGHKLDTSCGSLAYSAPEILLGDAYDAPAVDVWSLGVILYMLVCGKPPFQEANDSETLIRIMDCNYTVPEHVSAACLDLLRGMLRRDPAQRFTLSTINVHGWLSVSPRCIMPSSSGIALQGSLNMDGITSPLKSPLRSPKTPLVRLNNLTEDEHSYIIQRMVDGKIAMRDEIIQSLERNAYNHISATYYLLAERLLKKKNLLSVNAVNEIKLSSVQSVPLEGTSLSNGTCSNNTNHCHTAPPAIVVSAVPPTVSGHTEPVAMRDRSAKSIKRCSLIQEESCEEDDEDEDDELSKVNLTVEEVKHSKSISELATVEKDNHLCVSLPTSPSTALTADIHPLQAVQSMPQLVLNQISEEDEDEECSNTVILDSLLADLRHRNVHASPLSSANNSMDDRVATSLLGSKSVSDLYGSRSPAKGRDVSPLPSLSPCSVSRNSSTSDLALTGSDLRQWTTMVGSRRTSCSSSDDDDDIAALGGHLYLRRETIRQHSLVQCPVDSRCTGETVDVPTLFTGMTNSLDRRFFQQSKKENKFAPSRSIVGAVKKSVSMILGHLSAVGDVPSSKPRRIGTWSSCSDLSGSRKISSNKDPSKNFADRHRVAGCQLARELRQNRSERESIHSDGGRVRTVPTCLIRVRSRDFDTLVTKFGNAGTARPTASEDQPKGDPS